MDSTIEVAPLSADIQSPLIASTSESIPDAPLVTSTSTSSTLTQLETPAAESSSHTRPVAPLPIRAEGAANSPLPSPSATRISSRARKPSAKVVEMAEAGPSRIPATDPKVEAKPQPRFLQPDHFSELNNGAKPPIYGRSRWEPDANEGNDLSPEDDPLALRGIPVFKPTIEEFQDFEGYINRTSPWGMKSGIAKIIPPPEWTGSLPPMSPHTLSQVHIKSPIQQNMMGTAGIFRAQNIEKNKTRPLSVKEWFEKCQNEKFIGPSPKIIDRDSREALAARVEAANIKKEKWAKKKEEKQKRREEREELLKFAEGPKENVEMVDAEREADVGDGVPPLDAPSSGSSHSSPDPPQTPEEERVDEWYKTTDFNTAWLPKGTTLEDFSVEACTKLQKEYWKTMGLGEPSWYGADLMQGSLFADVNTKWNVAHLPNLLDRINCVLPGVNESYLYFGMWRATFAWHVEDMDLFSINYIHFGAPKFWYAIPQAQADHFERFLANQFPLDVLECDQFIRHKSIAISPTRLKDAQTRVNMIVHNQGEFMITYPRGYHAGFNLGFNCAESVNFATDDWVEIGRKAKVCQCVDYSVRIEMKDVLNRAEDSILQEKGEDGTKRIREEVGEDGEVRPAKTPKKRIRKTKSSMDISIIGEGSIVDGIDNNAMEIDPQTTNSSILPFPKLKKLAQPKPVKIIKEKPVYYCLFCPSLSPVDLCPVYEPNDFVKSQWKGQQGGIIAAHLNCAQSTPECYFYEEEVDGVEKIWIMGANDVVKDRWNALKCKLCPDKARAASGVKVQCTKGKCPAAYHYSCAKANESLKTELWQVEEWLPAILPPDAPPGTEAPLEKVSNVKLELLCPTHNPAQKEIKEREKAEELRQRILGFRPGQMIKVKQGSGCFEYKLVNIDEEKKEIEVQLYGETTSRIPWIRVDLRGLAPPKKVENDYARHHVTSRKAEIAVPTLPNVAPAGESGSIPSTQGPPARVIHPAPAPGNAKQQPRVVSSGPSYSAQPPHPARPPQPPQPPLHSTQAPRPQAYPAGYTPYLARSEPSMAHLSQSHVSPGGWVMSAPLPPIQQSQYQLQPPGYNMSPYERTPSPAYNGYPHPGYVAAQYGGGPPQPQYGHHTAGISNGYQPPSYPPQSYPPVYLPPPPNGHYYPPQPSHAGYSSQMPQLRPTMDYGYPPPQPQLYRPIKPAPPSMASNEPRIHPSPYGGSVRTAAQPPRQRQSAGAPSGMQHLMNPSVFEPPTTSSSSSSSSTPTSSGVGMIDLGLGRMQKLMKTIKPLSTPAIHIAGTNGKGSVSAMIESSLMTAGFRTARYNSPHLLEPRDAIRMNGRPVNAQAYNRAIKHFEEISSQLNVKATIFEIATAAAYALISEFKPDIMIIECGMGGSRDATNVIPSHLVLATILTPVGLDHTAFLGETVEAITEEKSSIAIRDALFVVARQSFQDAHTTAHSIGRQRGAKVVDTYPSTTDVRDPSKRQQGTPYGSWSKPSPLPAYFMIPQDGGNTVAMEVIIPLPGDHQVDNASTAITVLNHLRTDPRALSIKPKFQEVQLAHVQSGIERTRWAGRCSWLDHTSSISGITSPILVDGAHNSDSATSLRRYIDTCLPSPSPVTYVIGLSESKGKSPESVLKPLLKQGDRVAVVEFKGPVEGMPWIRPTPKKTLEGVVEDLIGGENIWRGNGSLKEALEWAKGKEGLTVVCGSLYLVADVYRLLGLEDEI